MGTEKVMAFYESWNGMLLAMYYANLKLFWSAPAWSVTPAMAHRRRVLNHAHQTALDILAGGMAPIHRRAVANAKRLRK